MKDIDVGGTVTAAALCDLCNDTRFQLIEQIGNLAHVTYANLEDQYLDSVHTRPMRSAAGDLVLTKAGNIRYVTTRKVGKGGQKMKPRVDKWVVVV